MKYFGLIYRIFNKITGMCYIGQTTRINPFIRINYHFTSKEKFYINNTIRKYGKDNFEIQLLASAFNLETLNQLEIYFINHFNSISPNGYNLKYGGDSGGKCSEDTKRNISNSLKGKPGKGKNSKGVSKSLKHKQKMSQVRKGFTSENRRNVQKKVAVKLRKAIKATNLETKAEYIFNSIAEAAFKLNIHATNISRVCNKRQNRSQSGGYKFEFI